MLSGAAVAVGLPILDCFLNDNGNAFAGTKEALPPCFGTWFWGLGLGDGNWQPKSVGVDYDMPRQLAALEPFRKKMVLFSGMHVFLDGHSNNTHFTGVRGHQTGNLTGNATDYGGSVDTIISSLIGNKTRFRSIEVSCDHNPRSTWSAPLDGDRNPSEISPLALYTRIFGPGYADPNSGTFTPDPNVMLRKSALSAVADETQQLLKVVGTADRQRIDKYFSSVRALEQKLAIQLEPPEPMAACTKPEAISHDAPRTAICRDAMANHELFGKLLVHALACGQTRVFNLCVTEGMSGLHRNPDDTTDHHGYSHEERVDPTLDLQPNCFWFTEQYMKALHDMLVEFDSIKEGDATLLDRTLVFAFTDHGEPRIHSVLNYPFMLFGTACGRIKTGVHIRAQGDAATRVGLTVQRAMGVQVETWGTESNRVTSAFTEILNV
jgi:hypothetical protein